MLTRRDVFRGLGLSVLAVGAVGLLDACGDDPGESGPVVSTDVDLAKSDVARSAADPAAIGAGVGSMRHLGGGLWGELSPESGNFGLSPFSVAVCLGLILTGANGRTRDEMLEVLSGRSVDDVNAGYNAVTQHVESLAGTVKRPGQDDAEILLDAANALFAQKGLAWEARFLDDLAASYGAGVQQVDYAGESEEARAQINDWTADQTHDKILELFPEGSLGTDTRLTLVNTLYLKAPWNKEFKKSETHDRDFHLDDGTTVTVPMMVNHFDTDLSAGDGWRAARIPYAGHTLAMSVVLPDEGHLADVEGLLSDTGLELFTSPGDPVSLDLTMPRWEFGVPTTLTETLGALGMEKAFSPQEADFSGMTREEQLFVGVVQHEVYVKVDEEGTEAAAATGGGMQTTSAGPMPQTLVLDRPFLFVIHDVEHGTPLFVGRLGDPRPA